MRAVIVLVTCLAWPTLVIGAAVFADHQARQIERLEKGQPDPRAKSWAEMVKDCEAHGGVAVPRATAVLGRSAELPACVPQLGD